MKNDLLIKRAGLLTPAFIRFRKTTEGNVVWCHESDDGERGMTHFIYCQEKPETAIQTDYVSQKLLTVSQVSKVVSWFLK